MSKSPEIARILQEDFYEFVIKNRDEILHNTELRDAFGEVYDEYALGLSKFQHSCFQGDFSDQEAASRANDWKKQFKVLKNHVERYEDQRNKEMLEGEEVIDMNEVFDIE